MVMNWYGGVDRIRACVTVMEPVHVGRRSTQVASGRIDGLRKVLLSPTRLGRSRKRKRRLLRVRRGWRRLSNDRTRRKEVRDVESIMTLMGVISQRLVIVNRVRTPESEPTVPATAGSSSLLRMNRRF